MVSEKDDLAALIKSEQQRGRKRPVDIYARQQQAEREKELLTAIRERRWDDVKLALSLLWGKESEQYKRALALINDFLNL